MSELDFKKQLLINEFKNLAKGKTTNEMLPLLMAVSQKAHSAGISFTSDDISLIINQIKDKLSPEELQLLPGLLELLEHQHRT